MERDEALERMNEIQRIMERTTLYTLLPGAPAIIGGVLALIGCGVSYAMIRSVDFGALLTLPIREQIAFCIMWTAIGVVAVAQEVVLISLAAKRQGISPVARPGRFAALSLTPSVFIALVFTLEILTDPQVNATQVRYIVPLWMMCYGTGVYAAGLFSVRLPRFLGIIFILSGAIGLLALPQYGLLLAAMSFGLFHIVFGAVVIAKSRSGAEA